MNSTGQANFHMRAFHLSEGISYLHSSFGLPLLMEIKNTLGLSKREIWSFSMVGVGDATHCFIHGTVPSQTQSITGFMDSSPK